MVAWAIWATTRFGDGEAFVRLAAPLAHGVAALMLARAGRRLYGGWTGLWGAVIYSLAPGVQLSAAVIATDSLVMASSALAVWSYAAWLTSEDRRGRLGWAAALGLALGLGGLSKYAIAYIALGLLLHAAWSPAVRRRWRAGEIAAAVGVALLALAPNLAWNAAHGFQTVAHTAHDAALGDQAAPHRLNLLDSRTEPGFILSQLGVFGPVPLGVLIVGAVQALRRRGQAADGALGALAAPALGLILLESFLARANANWAAVAYVPASLLVAAWLVRWRARLWLGLTVATGAATLLVFLAAGVSTAMADRLGLANSFKRARGWEALDALVVGEARALGPARLSAITVDDRFTFNALHYYGRRDWPTGAPPLTIWVREVRPGNEAETDRPLGAGARVLFVDIGGRLPGRGHARLRACAPARRLEGVDRPAPRPRGLHVPGRGLSSPAPRPAHGPADPGLRTARPAYDRPALASWARSAASTLVAAQGLLSLTWPRSGSGMLGRSA